MRNPVSSRLLILSCVLGAMLVLSACGQRVMPSAPAGKIMPSSQY